jgi:hypothetical protein
MEPNEVHEMHEHAEHAEHNPSLKPVTLTMSVLAVLVATVTLLSHRAHTEEGLKQTKANDAWSYYNTKTGRVASYEANEIMLSAVTTKNQESSDSALKSYKEKLDKWNKDLPEQMEKAKTLDEEAEVVGRRADRFDLGEVLLEIALIMTSITLLTGHRGFVLTGVDR